MIECPHLEKSVIRNHYDIVTPFYRLLWGPHIHHGYWEADESASEAQVQLTSQLAKRAGIRSGDVVYDIGCGMGGSSRWLAKNLECSVTGVTLSPFQRWWAANASRFSSIRPRPSYLCADAEHISLPMEHADVVWSIECTEHLFDKPAFFRRAVRWLKPGGRFALCAWLSGPDPLTEQQSEQARAVCKGMFCPSLGSQQEYIGWFQDAGFKIVLTEIWTERVKETWEICLRRVRRTGARRLAKIIGKNHLLFLDHFESILDAYNSGAMDYGVFVAEKPTRMNDAE
jgi:tocopherol O-methyltransferase